MAYKPENDPVPNSQARMAPAMNGYALTAGMISDTVDLPTPGKALRIFNGTAATVRLLVTLSKMADAASVPLDILAGTSGPEGVSVKRILSTGSTGLVAAVTAGTVVVVVYTE